MPWGVDLKKYPNKKTSKGAVVSIISKLIKLLLLFCSYCLALSAVWQIVNYYVALEVVSTTVISCFDHSHAIAKTKFWQ